MTDDRTLLEKSARVAGYDFKWEPQLLIDDSESLEPIVFNETGFGEYWNPLTDDGDALRLAVKLCMDIRFDSLPDGPVVKASVPWVGSEFDADYYLIEWLGKDSAAATRRAIVRAAASLGSLDEEKQP